MKQMTLKEFLKTPIEPLVEGGRYIPILMRAIPPDVEIISDGGKSFKQSLKESMITEVKPRL